jgi:hypothetical protein
MTCKQAAEVISRSLDVPLSTSARVGLGVHTLFCGPCRRFRRQLFLLHAACGDAMHEKAEAAGGGLSNEARARILTGLEPMSSAD